MLDLASKKIKQILSSLIYFFRAYLPHIVFLVFVFQLLSALNALPYFNIINKYYYYVFSLLWILANFLFSKYITNRRILIAGFIIFVITIIPVILEQEYASDILGFGSFVFISTYVIRQVVTERTSLKREIEWIAPAENEKELSGKKIR